jgi:hypothetical protein
MQDEQARKIGENAGDSFAVPDSELTRHSDFVIT